MKLYFKKQGDGPALFILHGLFGSGDNWQSHANILAKDYTVYMVDQRNHGRSPHTEDFGYPQMAADLLELVADEGVRDIRLIGHSMGGKTILHFAQNYPYLIHKMVVADMGVKGYRPHHDAIFKALFAADISHCSSRKEAEERMRPFVDDPGTLQFLLKNVYWKTPEELAWRFNLPVLFDKIADIIGPIPDEKVEADTLFLRGGRSGYIEPQDYEGIKARVPGARIETIEEAGHWLHAEAPIAFLEHVTRFLADD